VSASILSKVLAAQTNECKVSKAYVRVLQWLSSARAKNIGKL